jgi:hypothetical protein
MSRDFSFGSPTADNMGGTSEVPQLTDPLCATRKSAEVGQLRTTPAVSGDLFVSGVTCFHAAQRPCYQGRSK